MLNKPRLSKIIPNVKIKSSSPIRRYAGSGSVLSSPERWEIRLVNSMRKRPRNVKKKLSVIIVGWVILAAAEGHCIEI